MSKLRLSLVVVAALTLSAFAQKHETDTNIIRPVEINDVLVNPDMGIETFQRFNGDPINGVKWSEEGPTTRLTPEPQHPDFPDSSIAYCRWFWMTFEPVHGQIHWEIIDNALEQARLHHQRLAIRLMPYDQRHPLPDWYRNSGARRANKPTDKDGDVWQPDFSDPLYLKYWGEVVSAAGARYDGNPWLDSVDISSIGYWGEGWSDYMPSFEYQKPLIDIWTKAFPHTPLLMNFDQPEGLAYGVSQGAGWRLDCWGDMRSSTGEQNWSHMLDFYPIQIVQAGIQDAWQRSPVSLESCWVPQHWLEHHWDVNYIIAQALRWHVTSVNIKSSPIPAQWKPQFDDLQRKMGYRFILRRLEYPKSARAGQTMPVKMWWLNAGVAPIYRECWLALALKPLQLQTGTQSVVRIPADIRKWLPGDAVVDEPVYVPENLAAGTYQVRLALLDPRTSQPAIQLAIQGRQPDGWYNLGTIQLQR